MRRLAIALALIALLVSGASLDAAQPSPRAPRNIIIVLGDGAAGTQWELGRYTSHLLRQKAFATTDVVFRQGALGVMTVHAAGGFVTDSAAAATAMSTGFKTRNGMVGVMPDGTPVRTVMQAARANGKRTGLVTTAAVHDASPAAFTVHARSRNDADAIVERYLAFEPDVLLGGGRGHFLPRNRQGGLRRDGTDVIAAFSARGYEVVQDPQALGSARGPKLLGLFADGDMDHEIDREPARQPSTAEMAAAALRVLSANSPNGFVLFVENEGIDTAAHRHDAAALIRDLWALDDAVQVALEFQRRAPDETLVIVTGDHETGGLSVSYMVSNPGALGGNRYYADDAHLALLQGVRMSLERAARLLGRRPAPETLDKVLAANFPGFRLDDDLRAALLAGPGGGAYAAQGALAAMVSRQTGLYWGTSGHTTEPVLVGALGPGAEAFRGYLDNTDFGKILHRLIDGR